MPKDNSQTNKLLIAEVRNGNKRAFRRLFELYWEPMLSKAHAIVRDKNVSKDIVQEVWINLWNLSSDIQISNLEGYLFRAVRNGCFKYYRDKKFDETQIEIIENLRPPSQPEILQQFDLDETQNRIKRSLENLPPKCRQIFELSRIEQYSNDEIADYLGISKRSVQNNISLALKSLRHTLSIFLFFLV